MSFGTLERRGNGSPAPPSSRLFKTINSRILSQDVLFDEHSSLCEPFGQCFFFLTKELSPGLCQSLFMSQPLSPALALFRGLYAYLSHLPAYELKAAIWKGSSQPFQP
jgi:hypothetical protein